MTAPPAVDPDRLSGWCRTETTAETVFDLGRIEVTTATAVYEDPGLRDRVREATGVDRTWRFFFATRVDVPGSSDSRALRGLVTDRATSGFVDRLRDRGFEDVNEAERRTLRIGERDARAVRYEATCRVEGFVVAVDGWIAVWPDAEGFLLAGGAYPLAVREAPGVDDGDDDAGLSTLFDPDGFRTELFALVRATG